MARGKMAHLIGRRFGRLVVVEKTRTASGRVAWVCKCDCGKSTIVRTDSLTRGLTKSCGCLAIEAATGISRHQDLAGQRFGRLTAIEPSGRDKNSRAVIWKCKCDCGSVQYARSSSLNAGEVRSCGCLQRDVVAELNTTHGLSGGRDQTNRLYRIWRNMKQRCTNPNATKYELYGGRGIKVCDGWQEYEPFHEWATSNGYDDALTLERVDRDGHYEPNNCTWVSYKAQARNTVQNNLLTYKGKTMPLIEWVEKTGIKYSTLRSRVFVYGWSVERAIETPVRNEGAQ